MRILGSSGVSLHFEKHKGGDSSIDGLGRHDERQPGGNHSNENIDDKRTADNVILKSSDAPLHQRIENTIEANRDGGLKGVRKDAVRYVETTVQLSGSILDQPEEKQEETLHHAYDWLNERFGAENVVSAVIHKDETNMHLHLGFVPITKDQNKAGETKRVLKAKKVISQANLRNYQTDFLEFMQEKEPKLNFRRGGGLNGLSQAQFEEFSKRQKEYEDEVDEREDDLDQREDGLDKREKELNKLQSNLDELDKSVNEKINTVSSRLASFDRNASKLAKREEQVESDESDVATREKKLIYEREKFEADRKAQNENYSRLLSELTGEKEDWEEAKKRARDELAGKTQDLNMNIKYVQQQRELLDEKIKKQDAREDDLGKRESSVVNKEKMLTKKDESAQSKIEKYELLKKQIDERARSKHQELLKAIKDVDVNKIKEIKGASVKDTTDAIVESNNIFDFDGLDTSKQQGR